MQKQLYIAQPVQKCYDASMREELSRCEGNNRIFAEIDAQMLILDRQISLAELSELSSHIYGDMLKAVADVDRRLLALDAELHADLESLLLEQGSAQESLWGFNIYPEADGEDFIEFDSLINIRPRQGNNSREVEDDAVRKAICSIVDSHISK